MDQLSESERRCLLRLSAFGSLAALRPGRGSAHLENPATGLCSGQLPDCTAVEDCPIQRCCPLRAVACSHEVRRWAGGLSVGDCCCR